MVRRKCATSVLQLPACRPDRGHIQLHMCLLWRATTLFQVAVQTSGGDILPTRNAAQATWDDVVEGQIVARPTILAFELVAQEQVETREGGIFRRLHILAQCNDRRNLHVQIWTMHMPVIVGNNVDLIKKNRLDCGLPRPKAQRIIA